MNGRLVLAWILGVSIVCGSAASALAGDWWWGARGSSPGYSDPRAYHDDSRVDHDYSWGRHGDRRYDRHARPYTYTYREPRREHHYGRPAWQSRRWDCEPYGWSRGQGYGYGRDHGYSYGYGGRYRTDYRGSSKGGRHWMDRR